MAKVSYVNFPICNKTWFKRNFYAKTRYGDTYIIPKIINRKYIRYGGKVFVYIYTRYS